VVALGALPAEKAFQRLDDAFSEETDDGETNGRKEGYVLAATAVLDEWGLLVPDMIAIASFAWGLGHRLSGGAPADLTA
jgi:hypothetical protein